MLFHSELKNYELYHSNYRFIQCFNCQKYDHIIKICCDIQKCNTCIISKHNNHNCLLKNNFFLHHYVNYNFEHSAWFIKCRICKKQLKKIWLIYIIRFRKFTIVINNNYLANICFFIFFHSYFHKSFKSYKAVFKTERNSIISSEFWQIIVKQHKMSSKTAFRNKTLINITSFSASTA